MSPVATKSKPSKNEAVEPVEVDANIADALARHADQADDAKRSEILAYRNAVFVAAGGGKLPAADIDKATAAAISLGRGRDGFVRDVALAKEWASGEATLEKIEEAYVTVRDRAAFRREQEAKLKQELQALVAEGYKQQAYMNERISLKARLRDMRNDNPVLFDRE
jgi:sirohydrochlorin ferrochelatase